MYGKKQRIIIIIIFLVLGCVFMLNRSFLNGAFMLIGALILIYCHFRYGTVWRAFQSIKKNEYDKAKKELLQIKKPELLANSQKGYYYWSLGLIKLFENELDASEKFIRIALDIGVRTENDKTLIKLTQSEIYLKRGQLEEARKIFNEAKSTSHKPRLDEYLKEYENELYQNT